MGRLLKKYPTAGLHVRSWGGPERSSKYRQWLPVFSAWADIHRRYWEGTDDLGWWSGERANVSLLANAIWQLRNGYALQEYGDEKADGERRYRGRPDLFAKLGGHEFVVEARQCWPKLRGAWEATVSATFGEVLRDVASRNSADNGCRAALCFASYKVPATRIRELDGLVAECLRSELRQDVFSRGYRVDLFPIAAWRRFKVEHSGWPRATPANHFVGVTMLLGFVQ